MPDQTPKPSVWKRVLEVKQKADKMAARLDSLNIAESNPDCSERRRAYKAAGLEGGSDH